MTVNAISNLRFPTPPHERQARRTDESPTTVRGADDPLRDKTRLEQACADFEALLIQQLFQTMRASIPKSGLIDTGSAETIYTSMLDQKVAQDLALQGGLGLSSQIKEQIINQMNKLRG